MKKIVHTKKSDKFCKEVIDSFKSAKKIVITSHFSPDDDSIASVLSVYWYLTKIIKRKETDVKIYYSGEKNERWVYFENFDKINFVSDIVDVIEDRDLLVMLDGSGWGRFTKRGDELSKFKGKTICLDHHMTIENIFDLHLVSPKYTSTAELVYDLFYKDLKKLNTRICEILLMGIIGDSGNFKYVRPDQSEVFDVAKRLVRDGNIISEELQSKYSSVALNSFRVFSEFVKNFEVIKVKGWPDCVFSYIGQDVVSEYNFTDDEVSEGSHMFTPYLKTIKGFDWGLTFKPKVDGKSIGVSGRSIPGSVSIRDMFERLEIGGGHDRAAGGSFKNMNMVQSKEKMIKWMEKNKPLMI